MKIKHKCKKCAEESKVYDEWRKEFAEWSKRYAGACQCGRKE